MKFVFVLSALSLLVLFLDVTDSACPSDEISCDGTTCSAYCTQPFGIDTVRRKRDIGRFVYRVLRPDERISEGIRAKDPSAQKTVQSHVGCGCRPYYRSQYISTTTSLDKAKKYARGNRIVRINVRVATNAGCRTVDLTDGGDLRGVARNFAIASKEVLFVGCTIPSNAISLVSEGGLPGGHSRAPMFHKLDVLLLQMLSSFIILFSYYQSY